MRCETHSLCLTDCQTGKEGGVLVGALQSEREEETRDRAERASVVRGSDQASVAAKRIPRLDPNRDVDEVQRLLLRALERLADLS